MVAIMDEVVITIHVPSRIAKDAIAEYDALVKALLAIHTIAGVKMEIVVTTVMPAQAGQGAGNEQP